MEKLATLKQKMKRQKELQCEFCANTEEVDSFNMLCKDCRGKDVDVTPDEEDEEW